MSKKRVTARVCQEGATWTLHLGEYIHVLAHPREATKVAPTVAAYVHGGTPQQYDVQIEQALPAAYVERWQSVQDRQAEAQQLMKSIERDRRTIVRALLAEGYKAGHVASMLHVSAATVRRMSTTK